MLYKACGLSYFNSSLMQLEGRLVQYFSAANKDFIFNMVGLEV